MSLQVGTALERGFDQLTSERGALFVAVFVVFGIANTVVSQSLAVAFNRAVFEALDVPPSAAQQQQTVGASNPLALEIPLAVSLVLVILLFVVSIVLSVAAIRSFASDSTDPLPSEAFRDFGRTAGVAVAAAILSGLVVGIGAIFLLLPGLVFAILFTFVKQEVALNDSGVIESLTESVDIVSDNAIEVVALLVILFVLGLVASVPTLVLGAVIPSVIATVLSTVLGQVANVYGIATVTAAYQQATAEQADEAV